ncbi:MAG: Ldh family oxidoreductase [Dehalococcoidales bacterium]|jgi:ureidoglycolate dehydrogenase (NAD+)|nr:Ldh family oxidoreductase [Dehalococcoidales bacterium]
MVQNEVRVGWEQLKDFTREVFIRIGMPSWDAETEATVLVWANLRGVDSHGVLQIPFYVEEVDGGYMNPKPSIQVVQETPATMVVEADLAFGPVVTTFAMEKAMEKAKAAGIGWVFIRNTSHQGAMGYYSLMAVEKRMVGIAFVCTPPGMAPYGARVAGVDNSPITIAAPAKRHRPLLLDMATSVAAGGKIALAIDKGIPIPEGWALDKEGKMTTDPRQVAALLPFGGPKGSGLAIMLECLSSLIVNKPLLESVLLGKEKQHGHRIQNSVVAAINIGAFTDVADYRDHIDNLIDGLKALPKDQGFSEIQVPGESGNRTYDDRWKNGIPLPEGTLIRLRAVAERFEVKMPLGISS